MDDRYAHVKNMRQVIDHENSAKKSLDDYYKKHGYPDPKKPSSQPKITYIKYGICPKCKSKMKRKYWWYLWGKLICKNKECKD